MAELYVIGIGPGDAQTLTGAARTALEKAELICGYTLYAELLRPLYPEKEFQQIISTLNNHTCQFVSF